MMHRLHVRIRVHRWVLWWFYLGVICGVVAMVNILFRDLTRGQERLILLLGVFHWLLGGLVCYACEGIQIETPKPSAMDGPKAASAEETEWHAPSDFVLPGSRHALLPPAHAPHHRESLRAYVVEHGEHP